MNVQISSKSFSKKEQRKEVISWINLALVELVASLHWFREVLVSHSCEWLTSRCLNVAYGNLSDTCRTLSCLSKLKSPSSAKNV